MALYMHMVGTEHVFRECHADDVNANNGCTGMYCLVVDIMQHCTCLMDMNMSHFSALSNDHCQLWFVIGSCWYILYFPHDQQSLHHLTKHNMLAVQKVTLCARNEELAAVGPWGAVGHGE